MYNKYKNKKIVIDSIKFDSHKEARKYTELKMLERAGLIKNLELQKEFVLQPAFRKNNKSYRKITYKADFSYYDVELDKTVVIDVKPSKTFKTDVYRLKHKLFEYKYPDLEIKEVYK